MVATHSFENCSAINMETVNFLLLSCPAKTLNFTLRYCFLIEGQKHILNVSCSVVSSVKPNSFKTISYLV